LEISRLTWFSVRADLVLSFPPTPLIRFNSIFLSYNVSSGFTNALIGEFHDVYTGLGVEDFKDMLDNCIAYWAHPLLVPVLLLNMLMSRLEGDIQANIASIQEIENTVSHLPSLDMDARPLAERENVTKLLTNLHDTLKYAIKLLDAAHWMQKSANLLLETGNELDAKLSTNALDMQNEWAEIKDFLEDLVQITAHLEPDPVMTQQRCQSQIDIVRGLWRNPRGASLLTSLPSSTVKLHKKTIFWLRAWQSLPQGIARP
jgi:hypothetical protein